MLDDGTYEAIVVDATEAPSSADGEAAISLDLAILAGPQKGEVVTVRGPRGGDPIDLLGMPATLTVVAGQPSVTIDR